MTEEVRVHLFEPFFSTKQIGLGTGLGLSLTWGTIERHKGTIEVRSELGKGAEFIITLPLAQQVESTPTLVETRADLTGLRIVLAEDEAMVAASLKEILEQFGAIVNVFPNAQQTLGYLSVNANITEVLISDQGMPGMTGLELLAEVENHFPHIRRVILSGWGEQLADTIDTSVAERVVSKPIKGNDIAKMIQELLERA